MRTLRWQGRQARIWLGPLPDWTYEIAEVIERQQEGIGSGLVPRSSAAVELMLPRGARVEYGGLGAVFTPEETHRLVVQVLTSKGAGKPYGEALAYRVDTVSMGLPDEYREGIFDGVQQTDDTRLLGSGTLRFGCAVHGEVGSSRSFFRRLSRLVVQLLLLGKNEAGEEQLMRILQWKPPE